jgi:hypothetical protein
MKWRFSTFSTQSAKSGLVLVRLPNDRTEVTMPDAETDCQRRPRPQATAIKTLLVCPGFRCLPDMERAFVWSVLQAVAARNTACTEEAGQHEQTKFIDWHRRTRTDGRRVGLLRVPTHGVDRRLQCCSRAVTTGPLGAARGSRANSRPRLSRFLQVPANR